MNTPAHLALSLFVWRTEIKWSAVIAVSLGAILPDFSMFGFYLYQKLMLGTSEHIIWTVNYYQPGWQLIFDLFHSIPIILTFVIVFHLSGFRTGFLLAASALLHQFFDFPLHNDDAHSHFLPFSDWRFQSPISYWDPRHYGHIFIRIELVLALLSSAYVSWRAPAKPLRIVALSTFLIYAAFSVFAVVHWG